jgi:hypothetical protein
MKTGSAVSTIFSQIVLMSHVPQRTPTAWGPCVESWCSCAQWCRLPSACLQRLSVVILSCPRQLSVIYICNHVPKARQCVLIRKSYISPWNSNGLKKNINGLNRNRTQNLCALFLFNFNGLNRNRTQKHWKSFIERELKCLGLVVKASSLHSFDRQFEPNLHALIAARPCGAARGCRSL